MSFTPEPMREDPLEAIYALNLGDFLTESFISEALLQRIHDRVGQEPDRLKRQLEELIHIYSMDHTLGVLGFNREQGHVLYDSVMSSLTRMLDLDACHLFQAIHPETGGDVLTLTGTSVPLQASERWDIHLPVSTAHALVEAFQGAAPTVIEKTGDCQNWRPLIPLHQAQVQSLVAAPLREGKTALGVLVFESYTQRGFLPELVTLAETTARLMVTALRLQRLVLQAQAQLEEAEDAHEQSLLTLRAQLTESIADLGNHQQSFMEDLTACIDARHHWSRGHSQKVAGTAKALAQTMGLNEKTVDLVYYASLLGTVGKSAIPPELLEKKQALTPSEWEALQKHPNAGVALLLHINVLADVVPFVQYQKERWDGSGGPEGLKGQDIPLGARVLALADAYQALRQDRPYRDKIYSHPEALQLLQDEAGAKWDPEVVRALSKLPEARISDASPS